MIRSLDFDDNFPFFSERNSSLAERKPCISINLFNFLFLPQKVKGHFKEKEVNSNTLLIF